MNDLSSATESPRELRKLLDNNPPYLLPQRRHVCPRAQPRLTGHVGQGGAWARSSVRAQVSPWPALTRTSIRSDRVRRHRPSRRFPRNQPRKVSEHLVSLGVVGHPRPLHEVLWLQVLGKRGSPEEPRPHGH